MTALTRVLLPVLLLIGCAARSPVDVPLAPPVHALPFTTGSTDVPLRITQELTASFPDGAAKRSVKMLVILERRTDALSVVALTPAGIPLFSLVQEADGTLKAEKSAATAELDPERMLADLQLCLWPLRLLKAQLPGDFEVIQTPTSRTLEHRGQALIDVTYTGEVTDEFEVNAQLGMHLHHKVLGYQITVRNISSD